MRKSFWELATEFTGLENELLTINELFEYKEFYFVFSRGTYTLRSYISSYCFATWAPRNNVTFTSIQDLMYHLNIANLVRDIKMGKKLLLDEFLLYVETIYNLVNINTSWPPETSEIRIQITRNIELNCARIGFEVKKIGVEQYIIVEKNAAATAVADKYADTELDFSFKVIEYNHFLLKGNITRKREILLALGQKFEEIRPQLESGNFKDVAKDAGLLLNKLNIRHNNTSPDSKSYNAFVAQMPQEELEAWYDKTYDILLLALLTDNFATLHQETQNLKALLEP